MQLPTSEMLMALLAGISGYLCWILKKLAFDVESLNEKMAVVLSRLGSKEKMLDDHEQRLRRLEAHHFK